MSKSNCYLIIFLILSFVFSGCFNNTRNHKPPSPNVTTTTVKQQDVPIYIDTIGQVIPPVTVNIRPQVNGKLIKAYIQQGAIVKEGDVLYEIDPRPYQAILDEAIAQLAHDQALLEYANQTVMRYKKVLEDDFISILTYEQYESTAAAALAQVNLDKAAITAAQINVDFCKIVAPVSGKISYFNVDVGNILIIDDPNQITVIRPFSPIDITLSLPQQQFELIRHEQGNAGNWRFVATLPENPKNPLSGTTYFLDNQINQNTGTILLKGRLPNVDRELWPGEFIRIKVLYKMAPKALAVPPSSVLMGKDGPYIYTVDKDNKAEAQNVTVLTRTEEYIAIQSDTVHAGDIVIVEGQINVAPGLMVNVANAPSNNKP
jgi:membrane fusion protein, multidrug efflux system